MGEKGQALGGQGEKDQHEDRVRGPAWGEGEGTRVGRGSEAPMWEAELVN